MTVSTDLVLYDAARSALAKARNVDEVKSIRDRAAALRAYARQAKDRGLEVDAAEIRLRAERRLGEILAAQKALPREQGGGLHPGGRPLKTGTKPEPVSLEELGIDKKLSSRAQKFAAVPEAKFERQVADWRSRVEDGREHVTSDLAKLSAPTTKKATDATLTPRRQLERELSAIHERLEKLWEEYAEHRDLIVVSVADDAQFFRNKRKAGQ